MTVILQVALGGALGAVLRYAIVSRAALIWPGFPVGTLGVNAVGSFVMGLIVAWSMGRGGFAGLPFLTVGLLGGFTTFSAYSLESILLIEKGETVLALLYVFGSVVLSLGCLAVGLWLGRGMGA